MLALLLLSLLVDVVDVDVFVRLPRVAFVELTFEDGHTCTIIYEHGGITQNCFNND